MKNAFKFILKALFILKIFKFFLFFLDQASISSDLSQILIMQYIIHKIHKIFLAIRTNSPFLYTSSIFHLLTSKVFSLPLYLSYFSPPYIKSIFPTSAIYPIHAVSRNQWARESCKNWHFFNLSLLPQRITGITGLTITDFLSLRLIKLVYFR